MNQTAQPDGSPGLYADVLFPVSAGAFTYRLPPELADIRVGTRVRAPFRRTRASGVVTALSTSVPPEMLQKLKSIDTIEDASGATFLPESLLKLIHWVSSYYMTPPGAVLKYAIPAAVWEGVSERKRPRPSTAEPDHEIPRDLVRLTSEQESALSAILGSDTGTCLLLGVTGSGKTEVYIRAVEAMLAGGRTSLVLVPEIALTAQIVSRFRERFGESLSVFHSGLSDGERVMTWGRVRSGHCRVALGVRSAIFLPFPDPGLIIVDEEHSGTFKQSEGLRYHARDMAVVRGSLEKCRVVLGSATPSLESYRNALEGRYELLKMTERVEKRPLPEITLIDMKTAPRAAGSVSEPMAREVRETMAEGGQILLLLNRRGFSHLSLCQDCGHVEKCPACSVSLTYHKRARVLKCHHCGGVLAPKDACSRCGGARIVYLGEGTERSEEEIGELFPETRSIRMDYDTTRRRDAHRKIIDSMESGENQVLLGTQMVAKGHDLPGVVLAGVLSADVMLGLPDFRSAEKGFQLFTQLAGRSGRGEKSGRVLIQTHDPDHYVFEFVKNHDYEGFARFELAQRKSVGFPPYSRVVRLVFSGRNLATFEPAMNRMESYLKGLRVPGVRVLGPSTCPIERLRGAWRWHALLKSENVAALHRAALRVADFASTLAGLKADVDVDPLHML